MGERRAECKLAAILAADVAGYSRLMGIDEEGTHARLKAYRRELIDPKIAEYRGRIVKTTGDGMLVEFPSVVDAVRCAMEAQRALAEHNKEVSDDKRIELRVGINLGDVIVDADDILGDGVNIAARLEALAEPGGICISQTVLNHARDKISFEVEDAGEQTLKNIARPIHVYRIIDDPRQRQVARPQEKRLALPDKPSIAVLPFQNMSGDPEQEYFADGMVEDIITGLSRINWLFVIARHSSFVYKGKAADIKQVARELGVRYVLEGSVRKSGNRVRITGQLVEAGSGVHLWADKYDGEVEDVFDLQDRITASVVGIVEPSLKRAEIERARRKRPDNLDAYDLCLRALPHFASAMPEEAKIGMELLEKALSIDPTYAIAHAYMARGMEICVLRGRSNDADALTGVRHARLALAYGGDDATALAHAGFVMMMLGHDFEAASDAIARAVLLNGSCAVAFYHGALIHSYCGTTSVVEDYANRALRLSPFDPLSFSAYLALGHARFREQRYDDAAAFYSKGAQANPRFSSLYGRQAAALALAGRIGEAKLVGRRLLELDPGFRIQRHLSNIRFAVPEVLNGLARAWRDIGLPE